MLSVKIDTNDINLLIVHMCVRTIFDNAFVDSLRQGPLYRFGVRRITAIRDPIEEQIRFEKY